MKTLGALVAVMHEPTACTHKAAPRRAGACTYTHNRGSFFNSKQSVTKMSTSEHQVLPEGVQRVKAALQAAGHAHTPVMLDGAARTAQEAADSLGVQLGQIAKSVIFKRKEDGVAVLVVTSGDRRVDEKKVAARLGKLGRADADFVKAHTGFSIGGVSPVGHLHPPLTLLDQDLWRFDEIWAAAGHPHGVFRLSPQDLPGLTGASAADVVQDSTDIPMQMAPVTTPLTQDAP